MKTSELNKLSIKGYLAERGIHPAKEYSYYGMYHSPLRKDHNASFKVDYLKNLWIDFGSNEGGTMIDLVMRLNNCTVKEAIIMLERRYDQLNVGTYEHPNVSIDSFSCHGNEKNVPETPTKPEQTINILNITPLTNPALLTYLSEQSINIEIAKLHCLEVHYTVDDKPYFAIGFKNDSGDYELRNKYFKGCTSKDITSVKAGNNTCQLFEGFLDYLSFLTLKNKPSLENNVVILNSVNNLSKAIEFLKRQDTIHIFLDNDDAGRKCLNEIRKLGISVSDQSKIYSGYKDLNDYLTDKRQTPIQIKRPTKGRRM